MAWRGLHLTQPARLNRADSQLVVSQEAGEVRVPLEDLAWIVVDTPQATLTSSLLSACMDAGVALIATDATHLPSGVLLPFHRHWRQAELARLQAGLAEPLRKRLWQKIIRAKIQNQAAVLMIAGRDGGEALQAMARQVASGDPGNVEARAARFYWGRLFDNFHRENGGDRRNKLLNYGYAIVRSGIARALVAVGLLPCLGLKHAGATNAFNLADDVLEPFRPFVDLRVARLARESLSEDITLSDRRALAALLTCEGCLRGERMTLLAASEQVAESLVRSLDASAVGRLELPTLKD